MFITEEDLKPIISQYQLEYNPEYSTDAMYIAISTAISEVKGYLSRYDTEKIFSAEGTERDALLVSLCVSITSYYLLGGCNVDAIQTAVEKRYEKAIRHLDRLRTGEIQAELPPQMEDGKVSTMFRWGSNGKISRVDEY